METSFEAYPQDPASMGSRIVEAPAKRYFTRGQKSRRYRYSRDINKHVDFPKIFPLLKKWFEKNTNPMGGAVRGPTADPSV